MSLRDSLKALLRPYDMNERQLTPAQVWGRGGIWQPLSAAGISVTAEQAMQSAIGACVRLLADDISSLPVDVYRKVDGESTPAARPPWLEYPTGRRWDTFQAHISDVVVSTLTDGNAFVGCAPDTYSPRMFSVKDPDQWQVVIEDDGGIVYTGPNGQRLTEAAMMHIPWVRMPGKLRGLSVLDASRESTGLELAARQWASAFFGNGGTLGTIIKHPGKPSPEELDLLRDSFQKRHAGSASAFKLGLLTGGADIVDGTIKPQDAALEPLWKHVLEEAARLFHIPPHLLGSQATGTSSYASVEQKSIEYVQHAVIPVTTRIEAAYGRFLPAGTFLKFNTNALMRGDMKTRAEWYTVALQNKVMLREEVRSKEDLPSLGALGWLETPNNNAAEEPAEAEPAEPEDEAAGFTFAPELRIDSVSVSEQGVDRIAAASTDGIATGIAVLGDTLTGAYAEGITRTIETVGQAQRDIAELRAQLAEMEAREERRSAPVSIRVDGDTVYEQRGDSVVRKRITRNESGKVIGLIAEAS